MLAVAAVVAVAVTTGWAGIASVASAAPPSTTTSGYASSSTTAATYATSTTAPATSTTLPAPTTLAPTTAPSAAPTTAAPTTVTPAIEAPAPQAAKPFPSALVGPIPAADVPLERAMTDLYVVPGGDADSPEVVVQFRSPFPLPDHPYRVSVVVGDPYGVRLRSSLIVDGTSPNPTWREERAPANPAAPAPNVGSAQPPIPAIWDIINTRSTGAVYSPTGQATITVPLKDAPDGQYVWATVETGTDGTQVSTSPLFARAALFARTPPAYPLPSTTLGQLSEADGSFTGQFVSLPPGPNLAVKDHALAVTTTERPPTDLAGQKVAKVIDIVRVAPSYDTRGVVTDYVSIDRTSGEVNLIDGMSIPPRDRTGDRTWLTGGLTPGDPAAPATVQVDLAKMVKVLGIDASPDNTAVGIRRQFVLADGRQVVAEAVLGTLGWFDPNALASIDQPQPFSDGAPLGPVSEPEAASPPWIAIALALLLGIVVLVVLAAAVVRARRHRRARGDAADELTAIAVETAEHRAITREERRLATLEVPAVAADDATGARPPRPAEPPAPVDAPAARADADADAGAGAGASASAPADELDEAFEAAFVPDPPPRRDQDWQADEADNPLAALIDLTDPRLLLGRHREPAKRDPEEALATFEADFDALTARLRRIEVPAGRRRDFADPDHVEQF